MTDVSRPGTGAALPALRLVGGAWRSILWGLSALGGTAPFGRLYADHDTIAISVLGFGTGPIPRREVHRIHRRRVCYFRVIAIQYTDRSLEPLGFAGFGQRSILQQLAERGWPADTTPLAPLAAVRLLATEVAVLALNLVVGLGIVVGVIALVAA